jgi:hypothetical protein
LLQKKLQSERLLAENTHVLFVTFTFSVLATRALAVLPCLKRPLLIHHKARLGFSSEGLVSYLDSKEGFHSCEFSSAIFPQVQL